MIGQPYTETMETKIRHTYIESLLIQAFFATKIML